MAAKDAVVLSNRFRDFDDAVGADEGSTLSVKVKGRTYDLPGDLPAAVVLGQLRHLSEEGTLPTQYVPEWLEALVGPDNMKAMLLDGMTWKQLEKLTRYLLEEYGVVSNTDDSSEEEDSDSPPQ